MKLPESLKNNYSLCFFGICWVLLSIQIIAFNLICGINDFSFISNLFLGCSESLLILSPYLVIPRKWRWSVVFPMIILPLFLYANALYLRWFPDLMAFSIIANGASNATGTVAEGAFSCVKAADLWIIAPLLIFIILYCFCVRRISRQHFSMLFRCWSIIGVCMVFFLQQLALIRTFANDFKPVKTAAADKKNTNVFYYHKLRGNARSQQLKYYGLLPYFGLQTYELLKPKYIKLSQEELKEIKEYITENNSKPLLVDSLPVNKDKNLILIVVESLISDALNVSANGRPIMPFLTSYLKNEKNVIRLDSVVSQVGIGRSSDGRFIYQTGLLPITDDPIALKYLDYQYPSLSEALQREGVEFDGGDPIQWNKPELSRKYGFSRLREREEVLRNMKKLGGKDPAMFNNAIPLIKELPRPFYIALNTMDMHDPYDKFGWKRSDVWEDPTFSDTEKIYIEKCRQFDAGLSQFIASLKKEGLYDNSVIVITGDHNARPTCLNGNRLTNTQIPLIILNSGIDINSKAVIGQSDVYPTLLDLMGVSDARWRGVGTSIFRNPAVMLPDSTGNSIKERIYTDPYRYPSEEAWRVSDLIIRSAYHRDLK